MQLILVCNELEIFAICREFLCIGGFYAAFKAGLVSPDAIVALMNRWEFTAKFSHIIANNPNVRNE